MVTLAALLLLASSDAKPNFRMTAAELHATCARGDDDLSLGLCVGFISGVLDDTTFRQPALGRALVCAPQTASNAQVKQSFESEYAKRADGASIPAAYVAAAGLAAAFSCGGGDNAAAASKRP